MTFDVHEWDLNILFIFSGIILFMLPVPVCEEYGSGNLSKSSGLA